MPAFTFLISPKKIVTLFLPLAMLIFFMYCHSPTTQKNNPNYLPYNSLQQQNVAFAGMQTCRSCHQQIYDSFMHTGMGQSFSKATPQKSAAHFAPHTVIHDTATGFYYHPFFKNDSLFFTEFLLNETNPRDTVYKYTQHIQYIIGSGQHTNSHIYEQNGYFFQAPITFYTQKKIWDLAPGFNAGFNARFDRTIQMECMTCHNHYPELVQGSENKYISVPQGIECERCHGAGSEHVKQKLAGIIVDTATQIDYTIVNPKKLPRDEQLSVCQRCHLQGIAILKDGKNFTDFKPAMHLSEVMDVFLPQYNGAENKFIMASQANRLTKSACFKNTQMTCLNCHNPHVSVTQTPEQHFNKVCQNCHSPQATHPQKSNKLIQCTASAQSQKAQNNNCFACHMPQSPTIDIPHVTVTDHYIRKPLTKQQLAEIQNFIGLKYANFNPKYNPLTQAKAYLHYFESYDTEAAWLDSAYFFLQKAKNEPITAQAEPFVQYFYLKKDFKALINFVETNQLTNLPHAWTAYRTAEAYLQIQQPQKAENYLTQALETLPLQPDFITKLGIAQLQQNKLNAAQNTFLKALQQNPKHQSALTNAGYTELMLGNLAEAKKYYDKALQINPLYESALLNMAGWYALQKNKQQALLYAQKVLKRNPKNAQALQIVQQQAGM